MLLVRQMSVNNVDRNEKRQYAVFRQMTEEVYKSAAEQWQKKYVHVITGILHQ
jgi:hypothetical protein